ncbi:MAG: hypothetical protein LC753_00575 [Acidobacteria bacterium]|nr:hypothetical protein [Acidobacteriota bacterium]MCA1648808.1 hypothetical protein [Acidobacteriota bacterium]
MYALLLAATINSAITVETLRSTGGLPAHLAGSFEELTTCQQSPDGAYYVFDRRSHAVFSIAQGAGSARRIVQIGTEPGRILDPSAFDLAPDGSFVIADAPAGRERVQLFLAGGSSVGGFSLPGRAAPRIMLGSVVLSGVGSLEYTGRTILMSQPETGALVTEYALTGSPLRTFGLLRRTDHETDRDVHLALNAGLTVRIPQGGYYFVFQAGLPVFRKYDPAGTLVFERHVEGSELDAFVRALPGSWPRRRGPGGEFPVVTPTVRAAAADTDGRLWISLTVPYTYVYDTSGDKIRTVQFRGAGIIAPTSLFFTSDRRLLVTPGCYAFPTG